MVNDYTFEKIFKEYEQAKDKREAVIQLSKKCEITISGLLQLLLKEGYKIPMDLLEEIQESPELEQESEEELYSSIAIQRYWEERWKDLDDIEKAMRRHEYIKEKFKINDFAVFCFVQDFIIKNSGVNGLLHDVERVMNGTIENRTEPQHILENVKTRWITRLLNELVEEEDQNKPYMEQAYKIIQKVLGKSRG